MTSETLTISGTRRARRVRWRWILGLRLLVATVWLFGVGLTLAGIPARFAELLDEHAASLLSQTTSATYILSLDLGLALIYFVAAGIVVRYRPNDPVALLLALTLITLGATETDMTDALINPAYNAGGDIWNWPVWSLRALAWAGALLLLYVFPDGRPTPRWTAVLMPIWAMLNMLWLLLPWLPFSTVYGETWNNTPLASLVFGLAWFGTGMYAQVYRYGHVSDPLQRQQLKWAVAGFAAAMAGGVFYYVALTVRYEAGAATGFAETLHLLGGPTLQLGLMALLPVCVAIAILRYRLWDIDIIINRTLVYSALTFSIVGFYVLVVAGLGSLVHSEGNLLVSLIATGIIAVFFAPLRERLQRTVNRLMYGQRDDPFTVVSRLGRRLEATLAPDAVLPAIVETVVTALKLPYAAIELRAGDNYITAAEHRAPNTSRHRDKTRLESAGTAPSTNTPEHTLILPLAYRGEPVGQLRLVPRAPDEPLSDADRRLVDDLARQAGTAVQALRLTTDLQRATSELQAAHARLISAREEERRRLRRDLHDGLGPVLASLTFKLDAARNLLRRDPERADALLSTATEGAVEAIADIRRLVYALRPPALDELGLVSAIGELGPQDDGGVRIAVEAPEPLPPLPAAVEVAAYRIVQEAVTNVARHAQARTCIVWLRSDGHSLSLEIQDDGRGFGSSHRTGVGLQSMRERAAELGGTLEVENSQGGGIRVRARLPFPTSDERRGMSTE